MSAAILIMSCLNVFSINRQVNKISASLDSLSNTEGVSLPLDKSGKNVVVIMMDRAICEFFPYIIEEKPELKEQLAGFTYYPNTIAYGSTTLVASPCLFGGYEYTPENINKRNNESLKDKQTEALKLMPVIFSDNGYEVTVCDPPFAGFDVFVDLNIYNDYPQINRYITKNLFSDGTDFEITRELLNRNFFAYSLMRVSPSLFHLSLYNNGRYNHLSRSSVQVPDGRHRQTVSGAASAVGSGTGNRRQYVSFIPFFQRKLRHAVPGIPVQSKMRKGPPEAASDRPFSS